MTKRRKLMPPLPPSTLLASTLSNPMVCCFNLCLTFKVLFYCIHLLCLFSQSLLPRVASTSVASRVKPLPLLSSPRIYTRTIFLTFSALETCTPTSSFLFIYFFFAFIATDGPLLRNHLLYYLCQLHVIFGLWDSRSVCLPRLSISSLLSFCQTFISEGQLLYSDPSFLRLLHSRFNHDSHIQESKVFISIVSISYFHWLWFTSHFRWISSRRARNHLTLSFSCLYDSFFKKKKQTNKQKPLSYTNHGTKLVDLLFMLLRSEKAWVFVELIFLGNILQCVPALCRTIGLQGRRREGAITIKAVFDSRGNEQNTWYLTLIIVRICCGIITIRSIDLLRARLLSSLSLPVTYGLSLPKDPFLDVPLQEVRDCCSPRVSLSCLAKQQLIAPWEEF